jgi:hypothetical protein
MRKYELLHVPNTKIVAVRIVNSRLEEIGTHFVDRRTVPCTGPDGACQFDHRLVGGPRYGGWLSVVFDGKRKTHLLRLTAVAVATEARLRDPKLDLRGLLLNVWRLEGFERSEMQARLFPVDRKVDDLPPAIDLRQAVERMLGAEDRPPEKPAASRGYFGRSADAQKGGQS